MTTSNSSSSFADIDAVVQALQGAGYFADRRLATAVFLALKLERPLLLEGEPGVGKTELAKALGLALQRTMLRLQCYDGLEQREALYEWNYAAQLLHMRATELQHGSSAASVEQEVYQERYLIRRPLLQALQTPAPGAVLLIDEVDRADEPFEAFLLEYLGEYQVSIPEMGTVRAIAAPVTILTSNRTRELNDAVKRRCLYHWLDTRTARANWRSCVRGCHRRRRISRRRWRLSSAACAACRSPPRSNAFRALPRAWNGPRRWSRWTPWCWTPKWWPTRPAFCSNSAKTWRR